MAYSSYLNSHKTAAIVVGFIISFTKLKETDSIFIKLSKNNYMNYTCFIKEYVRLKVYLLGFPRLT